MVAPRVTVNIYRLKQIDLLRQLALHKALAQHQAALRGALAHVFAWFAMRPKMQAH